MGGIYPAEQNAVMTWTSRFGTGLAPAPTHMQVNYDLNYAYDMYNATGGDQPTGYDQLALRYEVGTVYGVAVEVLWQQETAATGADAGQGQPGLYIITDPLYNGSRTHIAYTNNDIEGMHRSSRCRLIPFEAYNSSNLGTPKILKFYVDIGEAFGMTKKEVLDSPNFEFNLTSGVGLQNFLALDFFLSSAGPASVPQGALTAKFTIYTRCKGRKRVPYS